MVAAFEIRDVSSWGVVNAEPIGRDEKWWLHEPGTPTSSREHDWLFKPVDVPRHGHHQGEDWVEKIVGELGSLLGVPCAHVELATRHGVPGSISRNVTPDTIRVYIPARGRDLVATAHHALDLAGERARRHWIERLRTLDWTEVEDVVMRTPALSDVTATFILELLVINWRRLLHED